MIRLDRFGFTYEDARESALRDIDLAVREGEFVSVVGAEGSGRTTLFRVLNGSAPRHFRGEYTGSAQVGGLNACEEGHAALGSFTASIFDDPDSQIVSLTVEDEVGFSLAQRGLPMTEVRERVREALALAGLSGFELRATGSLSGGQKQRLVTAAALALDPRLILLDESASALDPKGSRDLYSLLSTFSKTKNVTVVAIEHDLELLMDYADRIVVLNSGRVVLDAAPEEVAANVPLLIDAGVRVPVWLSAVSLLAERGLVREPYPESEAAAISALSALLAGDAA